MKLLGIMKNYSITVIFMTSLSLFLVSTASEKNENFNNYNKINSTLLARTVNFGGNDFLYLSELPLEKLLQVKKSLDELKQQTSYSAYRKDSEDVLLESRMIKSDVAYASMFGSEPKKSAMALVDEKKLKR